MLGGLRTPHRALAGLLQRLSRKSGLHAFQFLQTSGFADRSQRSRLGSRRCTLLMLKVAIVMVRATSALCL